MFIAQNDKINKFFSNLDEPNKHEVEKGKGKDKGKRSKNEFYQVNLCFIIISFVYLSLFN